MLSKLWIIVCFLPLWTINAAIAEDIAYPVASLDIKTQTRTLHFTVEVATTPAQQEHGLMYRKSLDDMHGMIFIFPSPKQVDFWMKNTLIPLDMLFADSQGIITRITPNAAPESTDLIASPPSTGAVIELAGGTALKYHIAQGDKVIYPFTP